MKNTGPKKIPTLVGLFLVVTLVAIVGYGFNAVTKIRTKAGPSTVPEYVTMTNISETSFTVTWITPEPAIGALIVTGDGLVPKTFYDDRDLSGTQQRFTAHSVTAAGLEALKTYTFTVISDGRSYSGQNKEYQIVTAPKISPVISGFEPAYGSVSANTGEPLNDGIVYLTLTGGQKFSTLIKDNGSWIIPLNLVRTADLSKYIPYTERIDSEILVRSGQEAATVTTDTLNDSPVPDVTIGKSYDFRRLQANKAGKPLATFPIHGVQSKTGQEVLGAIDKKISKYQLTITQPKNNATLISNLPLFTGTGVPDTLIQVSLGIKNTVTFSVKVGPDGVFRFSPKKPLENGKQSVTITGLSKNNTKTAVTHVFDILKSGTQVLGEATGSGTMTTPAPTPTRSLQPTVRPTATSAPVPSPTEAATPTPDESDTGYTPQEPPVTGTYTGPILLISVSMGLILGGFLLSLF